MSVGDLGMYQPIEIKTVETKAMTLKWLATRRQECRSRIAHAKQAIEDLIKGKIPDIERQILQAEQELKQVDMQEGRLLSAIDVEEVKS